MIVEFIVVVVENAQLWRGCQTAAPQSAPLYPRVSLPQKERVHNRALHYDHDIEDKEIAVKIKTSRETTTANTGSDLVNKAPPHIGPSASQNRTLKNEGLNEVSLGGLSFLLYWTHVTFIGGKLWKSSASSPDKDASRFAKRGVLKTLRLKTLRSRVTKGKRPMRFGNLRAKTQRI